MKKTTYENAENQMAQTLVWGKRIVPTEPNMTNMTPANDTKKMWRAAEATLAALTVDNINIDTSINNIIISLQSLYILSSVT